MANLGAFAGGIAQGWAQAEKIKAAREENEIQRDTFNRRTKLLENKDNRDQAEYNEKQDYNEFFKQRRKYYGLDTPDPDVSDVYTGGDDRNMRVQSQSQQQNLGLGTPLPQSNLSPDPMSNVRRQASNYALAGDLMGWQLGRDPKVAKETMEYMKLHQDDAEVQLMRRVYERDPEAVAEIVKRHNGDVAKFKIDPAAMTIDFGNGDGPVPMGNHAILGGGSSLMSKNLIEQQKGAQELTKGKQAIELAKELNQAHVAESKARAEDHRAGAAERREGREANREIKLDAIEQRKSRDLQSRLTDLEEVDGTSKDGKGVWKDGRRWVSQRVAASMSAARAKGKKVDQDAVWDEHLGAYNSAKADFERDWASLPDAHKNALAAKERNAGNKMLAAKQRAFSDRLYTPPANNSTAPGTAERINGVTGSW